MEVNHEVQHYVSIRLDCSGRELDERDFERWAANDFADFDLSNREVMQLLQSFSYCALELVKHLKEKHEPGS